MMMDIWYKGEWITVDDFTGHEWDGFENFEALVERECDDIDFIIDTNELIDKLITDDDFYDRTVGCF